METSSKKILLIKNLPSSLTNEEKKSLLDCFGPNEVRVMPSHGKMKNTAFIAFNNPNAAESALHSLHQLRILGCVLIAQYSTSLPLSMEPHKDDNHSTSSHNKSVFYEQTTCQCLRKLDEISPNLQLNYPSNPKLKYLYPEPNGDTLVNICSAMLTVPRFYVQVLHLMNKMNLYPPFSEAKFLPPILIDYFCKKIPATFFQSETSVLNVPIEKTQTSSESELESDESFHKNLNTLPQQRSLKLRKRKNKIASNLRRKFNCLKMQKMLIESIKHDGSRNLTEHSSLFEDAGIETRKTQISLTLPSVLMLKKPQLKNSSLTDVIPHNVGFGKIEPLERTCVEELTEIHSGHLLTKNFITEKELLVGKLSREKMNSLSMFKKYEPGEPSCRLYVKNLHKRVTQKDLHYIFGLFVNFSSEDEMKMFDIRLMDRGRMKGQAFVGLPSVDAATRAMQFTNGFQLIGKPIVVSYARSANQKPN